MRALTLIFIFLIYPVFSDTPDLRFSAGIDRETLPLDESLSLRITIEGSDVSDNMPFPELLPSPDFKLVKKNKGAMSSSSRTTIINGKLEKETRKSLTFTFVLRPKRTGELTLKGVKYNLDGKTVWQIAGTKVNVVKETVTSRDLSFRMTADQTNAFVGEQIIITLTIKKREGSVINRMNIPDPSSKLKKNFIHIPLTGREEIQQKTIEEDGEKFQLYTIKHSIFPISSGKFEITPVKLDYTVINPMNRRRSFFSDPFFDNVFGGGYNETPREKFSNSLSINVKKLPEKKSDRDFSGTVGNLKLSVSADKNEINTGDALTLTVNISGNTPTGSIREPAFSVSSSFEVFDPETESSTKKTPSGIIGTKIFKYAMIPKISGELKIPPVSYTYFDPSDRKYKTLKSSDITISAIGDPESQDGKTVFISREEIKQVGKDISFIKEPAGPLKNQSAYYYRDARLLLLQLLPLFMILSSIIYKKRSRLIQTDAAYARKIKAGRKVRQRLKKAETAMKSGRTSEFFTELSSGIYGFIGDKFNIPEAGLTSEKIDSLFEGLKNGAQLRDKIKEFIYECDAARFSGSNISESGTADFYRRASGLIKEIDRSGKK
ncbi:MAG: BatD family protein [Fibrobacterota bacterium]